MMSSDGSISERDHLTDETIVDLLDRLRPDRWDRSHLQYLKTLPQ